MLNAEPASESRAACRMRSNSGSFSKGITGETLTPTGMPSRRSAGS
jgi:hypothetical protein